MSSVGIVLVLRIWEISNADGIPIVEQDEANGSLNFSCPLAHIHRHSRSLFYPGA